MSAPSKSNHTKNKTLTDTRQVEVNMRQLDLDLEPGDVNGENSKNNIELHTFRDEASQQSTIRQHRNTIKIPTNNVAKNFQEDEPDVISIGDEDPQYDEADILLT
jgi:hypothetical protein